MSRIVYTVGTARTGAEIAMGTSSIIHRLRNKSTRITDFGIFVSFQDFVLCSSATCCCLSENEWIQDTPKPTIPDFSSSSSVHSSTSCLPTLPWLLVTVLRSRVGLHLQLTSGVLFHFRKPVQSSSSCAIIRFDHECCRRLEASILHCLQRSKSM